MEINPRKPYDGFIGTPVAKALGLVLAFIVTFLMMFFGAYSSYCLFVFVGVLLFVIPKAFGVKNFKAMLVLGVAFFLITTLVGTFMFTIPAMHELDDKEITGDFADYVITYDETSKEYVFTLEYTGTKPTFVCEQIVECSFDRLYTAKKSIEMESMSANKYQAKIGLADGTMYQFHFEADGKSSETVLIDETIGSDTFSKTALKGNMYVNCIPAIMFLLILVFSTWMRRNFEKQRTKLEAEGRLYPKGYGLCKKCGMTVLPGEKVCRKCGEPIEIPEEIQRETMSKLYGTVKCPSCGSDVVKIEKVCPSCKQTMPGHEGLGEDETFKCSKCGTDVPGDAVKCPMCGADFDEDDEPDTDTFECSECGAKVPGDSETCPKCGATFDKD